MITNRITIRLPVWQVVPTARGNLSFYRWCEGEAERIRRESDGRRLATVRMHVGRHGEKECQVVEERP